MVWDYSRSLSLSLSFWDPVTNLYKSKTFFPFLIPQFTRRRAIISPCSLRQPPFRESKDRGERRFLFLPPWFYPPRLISFYFFFFFIIFANELLNPRVMRFSISQRNYRNMYSIICTANGREARRKYTKGERQTIPVESLNLRKWRAAKS